MSPSPENTARKGGCLCGAVRYEIAEAPAISGFCYCLNCQKLSGAGHAFHAMFPESAFRVAGDTKGYTWIADSGNKVTGYFCPACGSSLFGRSSGFPGMVTVRVASLDDPSAVEPQMAVYTKRRQTWDRDIPSLPSFPAMPPPPPKQA